jgi:nucleotide-binding universal stress UspA family protein
MTQAPESFHVVVGCDFSPLAEMAITMAATVAGPVPGASLEVIHILPGRGQRISHARGEDVDFETRERLKSFIESALRTAKLPQLRVNAHVYPGDPATEILRLADDVEADLIVLGTHGRVGVKRLLLGSVAETVMREAHCPVLVMRRRQYEEHPELVPEPPCPDCVAIREQTGGAARWCPAHDRPFVPPHRYAYVDGYLHPYHSDGLG